MLGCIKQNYVTYDRTAIRVIKLSVIISLLNVPYVILAQLGAKYLERM
jgi:hypothetical protein